MVDWLIWALFWSFIFWWKETLCLWHETVSGSVNGGQQFNSARLVIVLWLIGRQTMSCIDITAWSTLSFSLLLSLSLSLFVSIFSPKNFNSSLYIYRRFVPIGTYRWIQFTHHNMSPLRNFVIRKIMIDVVPLC